MLKAVKTSPTTASAVPPAVPHSSNNPVLLTPTPKLSAVIEKPLSVSPIKSVAFIEILPEAIGSFPVLFKTVGSLVAVTLTAPGDVPGKVKDEGEMTNAVNSLKVKDWAGIADVDSESFILPFISHVAAASN